MVFRFVAHFTPARMVTILLASSCILARRLQVGGRNPQRPDARKRLLVAHPASGGRQIREALAVAPAPYAGPVVAHVTKSRSLRRLLRQHDGGDVRRLDRGPRTRPLARRGGGSALATVGLGRWRARRRATLRRL